MSSKKARVFVPLTKVDETQRLVYGRITQEMLDKSKEVMDYDSSKPFFKQWSDEIHENSGGLSKGNVRVMHGLTAAGKLTELDFNDMEKAIDVCAKVVDDAEWEKVVEGVYTGFSVGGAYEKRWTDTVDGEKIKKFTARPNEVSLVDNPCVPSATFSMMKADGAEEQIAFKVENDDGEWPDFAKVDDGEEKEETPVVEEPEQLQLDLPTNDQIVAKAEDMAKAAGDDTKTWMNFVEQARTELMKTVQPKEKVDASAEGTSAEKGPEDDDAATKDEPANKVTPAGVVQKWTTSDGQAFEKKDEAVAHENSLTKAEPTEAEKLKARLNKALAPEDEVTDVTVFEDYDRLGKVVNVLLTPFENGAPKLEKGMYTVSRFANVLWDIGSLTRCIKAEGKREGEDASDSAVSTEMQKAMSVLAGSFKAYVDDQITELLAGIDDELCVATYDYYYAAAQADPSDGLAKDVCTVISELRDPSREVRQELAKNFVVAGEVEEETDILSPPMQKRFDDMEKGYNDFKKIAEDAVAEVEKLTKRVETIEERPAPRAPRNPAFLPGDEAFFGKRMGSDEERLALLKNMIETEGPEGMAMRMIKLTHAQGGHQLTLKS